MIGSQDTACRFFPSVIDFTGVLAPQKSSPVPLTTAYIMHTEYEDTKIYQESVSLFHDPDGSLHAENGSWCILFWTSASSLIFQHIQGQIVHSWKRDCRVSQCQR